MVTSKTPGGKWWNKYSQEGISSKGMTADGRLKFKIGRSIIDISSNYHSDPKLKYFILHFEKTSYKFHDDLSLFFQSWVRKYRPDYEVTFERNKYMSNSDVSFNYIDSAIVPTVFEQVMNALDKSFGISEIDAKSE